MTMISARAHTQTVVRAFFFFERMRLKDSQLFDVQLQLL